jgi:hypothetical protein
MLARGIGLGVREQLHSKMADTGFSFCSYTVTWLSDP